MQWLVTVSVVEIGRRTGNIYHDTFTALVDGPDDFATAVNELVGSAKCDDFTVTGVTIVPTSQQN